MSLGVKLRQHVCRRKIRQHIFYRQSLQHYLFPVRPTSVKSSAINLRFMIPPKRNGNHSAHNVSRKKINRLGSFQVITNCLNTLNAFRFSFLLSRKNRHQHRRFLSIFLVKFSLNIQHVLFFEIDTDKNVNTKSTRKQEMSNRHTGSCP